MKRESGADLTFGLKLADQPKEQRAEAAARVGGTALIGHHRHSAAFLRSLIQDRAQFPVRRQPHIIPGLTLRPLDGRSVIPRPREPDDVALAQRPVHAERYPDLDAAGCPPKHDSALFRCPCPVLPRGASWLPDQR